MRYEVVFLWHKRVFNNRKSAMNQAARHLKSPGATVQVRTLPDLVRPPSSFVPKPSENSLDKDLEGI